VHPVGYPAVVSLAKGIVEIGIGDRVAKSGQKFPIVGEDIAIVEGNGMELLLGKDVAVRHPDPLTLALLPDSKPGLFDVFVNGADAGAFLPDNGRLLGQIGKEFPGVLIFGGRGERQTDNDLPYILHIFQLPDNGRKSIALEFTVEAGQDKGNGPFMGIPGELLFHFVQILAAKPVKGCNNPYLIEIGHLHLQKIVLQVPDPPGISSSEDMCRKSSRTWPGDSEIAPGIKAFFFQLAGLTQVPKQISQPSYIMKIGEERDA